MYTANMESEGSVKKNNRIYGFCCKRFLHKVFKCGYYVLNIAERKKGDRPIEYKAL